MLKKLKALPGRTKIILGCFLALFIYGAMQQPSPSPSGHYVPGPNGGGGYTPRLDDQNQQLLAQFEAQRDELAPKVKACVEEQNRALQETAAAAINGGMVNNQPACSQYLLQWGQQLDVAQTEIYRLKTGDTHSSFNQLNGVSPSSRGSAPSYYRPSAPENDGTAAVDRWDRGAIRGTTMYKDENGDEKELPTANYYYHDLETGQYVPSESSTPPSFLAMSS